MWGEAAAGIMGRRMVRRIGYILGLLFVLACALAYPLTWGREADVAYTGTNSRTSATVHQGALVVGRFARDRKSVV